MIDSTRGHEDADQSPLFRDGNMGPTNSNTTSKEGDDRTTAGDTNGGGDGRRNAGQPLPPLIGTDVDPNEPVLGRVICDAETPNLAKVVNRVIKDRAERLQANGSEERPVAAERIPIR